MFGNIPEYRQKEELVLDMNQMRMAGFRYFVSNGLEAKI